MSTETTTRPSADEQTPDAAPAVEVRDLVKRYGRSTTPAVDGLSFAVRRGEVFGLLGPNGAGKTTTVGVLTTRVTKTSGLATVAGIDVAANPVGARAVLGVVPQRPNLDRSLDARGNLVWHAAYHGVPRAQRGRLADELLDRMGLAEKAKTNPDELSGGQAQRLIIARGLMHDPQVLFLDEPSTGLDPQARLFVHDRVTELAASGVTVVLTTHDMDEAAKLADRVGIVDHGKLLALDTPSALVAALPGEATIDLTITGADVDVLVGRLGELRGVSSVEDLSGEAASATHLRVGCDGEAGAALPPVLAAVADAGAVVSQVALGEPTLEDVFIDLTGEGVAVSAPVKVGPGQGRAFLGVLGRDLAVTGKEFGSFISQVLMQPFFLLFVFGVVLGQLGYVTPGYAQLLLPGLLALNAFFVAVQATAIPLVIDFSYTKEIEDRLLAPLSTRLVAVEKIVFGASRGLFGSLVMIPVGYIVLDEVNWVLSGLPFAAVLLVLGSLAGGAAGLVLGTLVSPRKINVVFALVITPLLFTGSTQFPFLQLENLRWFQVLCALNPITYVSEGLRGALTPAVPHLPGWLCLLALVASCLLFGSIGIQGFVRRALD